MYVSLKSHFTLPCSHQLFPSVFQPPHPTPSLSGLCVSASVAQHRMQWTWLCCPWFSTDCAYLSHAFMPLLTLLDVLFGPLQLLFLQMKLLSRTYPAVSCPTPAAPSWLLASSLVTSGLLAPRMGTGQTKALPALLHSLVFLSR